jgi:hypothetical protein
VKNLTRGTTLSGEILAGEILNILSAGGVLSWLKYRKNHPRA